MRAPAAALLLLLAACPEPPKTMHHEMMVSSLADLHTWHPRMRAKGQMSFDAVMSYGDEIWPSLIAHLTDETPTHIREETFGITPVVGDVCFLILLDLTGLKWEDFYDDGVFVSKQVPDKKNPNPLFGLDWKPGSRRKVQRRFVKILELAEQREP